jgi:hypothetical protein
MGVKKKCKVRIQKTEDRRQNREKWKNGVLEYWSDGVLGEWNDGEREIPPGLPLRHAQGESLYKREEIGEKDGTNVEARRKGA